MLRSFPSFFSSSSPRPSAKTSYPYYIVYVWLIHSITLSRITPKSFPQAFDHRDHHWSQIKAEGLQVLQHFLSITSRVHAHKSPLVFTHFLFLSSPSLFTLSSLTLDRPLTIFMVSFFFVLRYCLRGIAYIRHHFAKLGDRAPMPANLRVTACIADSICYMTQYGNVILQCTLLSRYAGMGTVFNWVKHSRTCTTGLVAGQYEP